MKKLNKKIKLKSLLRFPSLKKFYTTAHGQNPSD